MKRTLCVAGILVILVAAALTLTGWITARAAVLAQQPTFEPVGSVTVLPPEGGISIPTQEIPSLFSTQARLPAQATLQNQAVVNTPPWMASTSTPLPLLQPRPRADLLRELLIGGLVLLGVGLVLGSISLLARWSLKREQEAVRRQSLSSPTPSLASRVRASGIRRKLPAAARPEPTAQPTALQQQPLPKPETVEPALSLEQPPAIESPAIPAVPVQLPEPAGLAEQMKKGIQQVRQGQLDEGIKDLRQVLQHQPQEPEAWLWLGLAFSGKKEWRTAERCLRQAEKLGHPQAGRALEMVARLSA